MDNIRILIINPWQGIIGPNIGFLQLAGEGIRRGHDMHALCPVRDEIAEQARRAGASIHVDGRLIPTQRDLSAKGIVRHAIIAAKQLQCTLEAMRRIRPAVACINSESVLSGPLAARIARVPAAVYVRGARFDQLRLLARAYFGFQAMAKPTYIAVSNFVGERLVRFGVSRASVRIIPNGVDLGRFRPEPADPGFAAEYGVGAMRKLIGAVCHLTPRKGVHHLVEIMSLLRDRLPEAGCLVAGSAHVPEYAAALGARIREYGLEGRMRLIGEQKDIVRFIAAMDIMIHPSETESFGRVIAESMAMGKPVIAFATGAVPELIRHGETGFIVRPFDCEQGASYAATLLNDPGLQRRMGESAVAFAHRHFDLAGSIGPAMDLLESLAARRAFPNTDTQACA